jgi:Fungal specific transcription factor domain
MQCSFAPPAQSIVAPQGKESSTVTSSDTPSRNSTLTSSSRTHPALVQAEPYVNATHLELLYCIIEDGEWAFGYDEQTGNRSHVLKYTFIYPFLLNEVLAVSALHLSTRRPAQKFLYREEATRLQSQAMRLFNETIRDLNHENIIPVFLFSGLLGIATFFETIHDPTYEASDWTFFEKIVQSIRLLYGVRTIVHDWWPFLLTTDIKHILEELVTPSPE